MMLISFLTCKELTKKKKNDSTTLKTVMELNFFDLLSDREKWKLWEQGHGDLVIWGRTLFDSLANTSFCTYKILEKHVQLLSLMSLKYIRVTTSVRSKFLSILLEKTYFFLFYTHFYKTHTSIYLFYHLFYLNNNISLIFYYIKKPLPTWLHPPSSFFIVRIIVRRRQMREQLDREREKKNKKIICT